MRYAKLWLILAVVMAASFITLVYFSREILVQMPPIPKSVVNANGRELFTNNEVQEGQNVWQMIGGQEVGSIWGHGAYVAPDWSADWLHRMAAWILEHWAETEHGTAYGKLNREMRAGLRQRLQDVLRKNTYNPQTRKLVLEPVVAEAYEAVGEHYAALFGDNPALAPLRQAYALPERTLIDAGQQACLNAFFFWTAWVCVTNRPGKTVSYTQNWPPDELVGNHPSGQIVIWSTVNLVLLLAGIGALAFYYAVMHKRQRGEAAELPERDPLLALRPTASMKATAKYFWAVAALIVVQVGLGLVTAHYSVQGTSFYGWPLAKWLPYSITRTWHLQLAIFWIVLAFLAAGLFMAPAVAGREPKLQRLGVNFLFVCLITIVGGSMAGQWWSVHRKPGLETSFWFGHQGLEYIDLGRLWQLSLFIALGVWLLLVIRAMWPALGKRVQGRHLLALFLICSTAIALIYGSVLFYYQESNLVKIELLRLSVVHLWLEVFFEVFATALIAFLLTRMGLLAASTATTAVLFTTTVFLAGAIIGTFHHLYFTGTPLAIMALGSTFSTLGVVPLVLIGFEGYSNLTLNRARPWVKAYQWPIYCFVAVAFWNLVGAGLFGFLLNTPIALYYMQGLNTTAVHSHTALFGIYGMLAIGMMLFCLKGLTPKRTWKTGALAFAFWAINIGLGLTALLSVLPIGLLQTWASVEYGLWFARAAEFQQIDLIATLRWLRIVGDSTFAAGVVALAWFVVGLKTGWSLGEKREIVLQKRGEGSELEAHANWDRQKWD